MQIQPQAMSRGRQLWLLTAFTLLLHLPFLTQPVQGDEVNYLDIAHQVFRQPLTPLNFSYVFQGRLVDVAGHPHPPLTSYFLALLLLLRGHVSVVFFHAYYLVFALGISFAAYAVAAYFTPQPLWAALLVAASPLVQVHSNALGLPESPALALLLVGAAAFFWGRFLTCGIALTLAGLTSLQALALPPILLLAYAFRRQWPSRAAWFAVAAPYAGIAAWEATQFALIGRVPGAVLAGYMVESGFNRLRLTGPNAMALLQHLGVLVTLLPVSLRRLWGLVPGATAAILVRDYAWWERGLLVVFIALGINALGWFWSLRRRQPALASWCLLYFAFTLAAFYAGAARYLLPLVAPAACLFVLENGGRRGRLGLALGWNLVLGLSLSFALFEASRVYASVPPPPGKTFLVNGEWGFRYYMVERGGRMIEARSVPAPGEWIVTSELSLGANYDSLAEEAAVPLRALDLPVRTPLRLLDRYSHAGFESAAFGWLPFSFSRRPLDRIAYARTSQFLNVPGNWTPTRLSGHLVYLAAPGADTRIPFASDAAQLHFALFARGQGQALFRIRGVSGTAIFEKRIQVDGNLWEVQDLPLPALREAVMSVEAPVGLQAGWGDLVDTASPAGEPVRPQPAPPLAYLKMGDLRSRPQLLSGWYAIEDGAWRWMGRQAEVMLRAPAGAPARFAMQLFFPPNHMARANGPVTVAVSMNGKPLARQTYSEPGSYRLLVTVPAGRPAFPADKVTIRLSRAVPPSGSELRELGAVVTELGFVAAE